MADRGNADSPPLPSTSRGNANRGLSSSSRRRNGSPPPRPSTSRGHNHRGWQSSSRGVTPRFRNFCITNEHPDGIVFCEPDGSLAENEMSTNQTDEELTSSPSPPPPSPLSSSSSGASSELNTSSCFSSPKSSLSSRSSVSDNGTIILSSSEDEDDYELDESKRKSKSKTSKTDKAQKQKGSDNDMSADENVNAEEPIVQPQPEIGHAAVEAVEDDEVPEYLHHKKFHYKQVQAAAAARSKELSVDNLRLSAYITQDQAASRLKALGDLQETQKEIDDFAAIICASNMYRLNLARGNAAGGSTIGRGRQTSLSTSSSGNQLPAIAELHEGSKRTLTKSVATRGAGHGSSGSGGGCDAKASTSTAATFQTAAAGTSAKDISIGDGNSDSYPVAGMTSGKGSYFQATSPGHASSTDDYEWISDADD